MHAAIGGAAWVLADDSGIAASALGGRPGVRSARFAGEHATDAENLDALLLALAGRDDRSVAYVAELVAISPGGPRAACAWRAARPHGRATSRQRRVRLRPGIRAGGRVAHGGRDGGREKDAISHRARAAAALREQLAAALQEPRARSRGTHPRSRRWPRSTAHAAPVCGWWRRCRTARPAMPPAGGRRSAGNRSLLKWWQIAGGESDSLEHIERVVSARGAAAPAAVTRRRRHLLTATAESLLFVLQELLPGRPPVPLLPIHVEQLVDLNRLQEEERGDGGGWGAFLCRTLDAGADGYCLHAPLRRHSPAGAAPARPRDRDRGGHRSRRPAGRRHRALRFPPPERAGRGRPHHRHRRLRGRARRAIPASTWSRCSTAAPRAASAAITNSSFGSCFAIGAMPPPCAPTSRTCRCG